MNYKRGSSTYYVQLSVDKVGRWRSMMFLWIFIFIKIYIIFIKIYIYLEKGDKKKMIFEKRKFHHWESLLYFYNILKTRINIYLFMYLENSNTSFIFYIVFYSTIFFFHHKRLEIDRKVNILERRIDISIDSTIHCLPTN